MILSEEVVLVKTLTGRRLLEEVVLLKTWLTEGSGISKKVD